MSDFSDERTFGGPVHYPEADRRIWLCADDYGISPSVNAAIRNLLEIEHINATSVMVVTPSFLRSEATALETVQKRGARFLIGLHLTLSAPFRPLTESFGPTRNGAFPTLGSMLVRACLRRLQRDALRAEIAAQIRMFTHTFGRAPDFIDGHQHVQLFPQISDALLEVAQELAPDCWIRQCGRSGRLRLASRLGDRKGLLLDVLSARFRRRAAELGVWTNSGFAGTYTFSDKADFATLFPRFLQTIPDGGVVMCHPGFVDAELQRLDPLTSLREQEYAFFAAESFPKLLASHGVSLA